LAMFRGRETSFQICVLITKEFPDLTQGTTNETVSRSPELNTRRILVTLSTTGRFA
jgi:hypothetical protein